MKRMGVGYESWQIRTCLVIIILVRSHFGGICIVYETILEISQKGKTDYQIDPFNKTSLNEQNLCPKSFTGKFLLIFN